MNIYVAIIILFIGAPLLFFGMFKAARWSRMKNDELKAKNEDSQEQALKDMAQGKKGAFIKFHTSSIPNWQAFIGKILAVAVIMFLISLALILAYYALARI